MHAESPAHRFAGAVAQALQDALGPLLVGVYASGSVFGPVARPAVPADCRSDIEYWFTNGPDTSPRTALLIACRPRRYAEENVLCSKIEGVVWARQRVAETALIDLALMAQLRASDPTSYRRNRRWRFSPGSMRS